MARCCTIWNGRTAGLSNLTLVQRTIEDFYLYERDSDQEDILSAIRGHDDELIERVEDTSTTPTGGGVLISGLSELTQDQISSGQVISILLM